MKQLNIPFVKWMNWLFGFSLLLVAISIYLIATKGFNYGIDFNGGAKLAYQFKTDVNEESVRSALKELNMGDASVVRFGKPEEHRMSVRVEQPEEHTAIGPIVTAALEKNFGAGQMILEKEETVGPRAGEELRRKALYTIILSWVLMLVYIGYRFDFTFSPGAIVALVHDVIITLGIFALMGKEMDLTILAALLTLIGYSTNDTIVVFDRIREHKDELTLASLERVVNSSLNSTLGRTIITSLTVFFMSAVLFWKGGGTLHDFSFAMTLGVVIGTYSSLFVATPVFMWLYRRSLKK